MTKQSHIKCREVAVILLICDVSIFDLNCVLRTLLFIEWEDQEEVAQNPAHERFDNRRSHRMPDVFRWLPRELNHLLLQSHPWKRTSICTRSVQWIKSVLIAAHFILSERRYRSLSASSVSDCIIYFKQYGHICR